MLPVVAGARETKKQILIYTALLIPVSLAPWALGIVGWAYGVIALALGGVFMALAVKIWFDDTERSARRTFLFSIIYLFALFAAMMADAVHGMAAA
jgi:protoheme IX farnesyltransferase